MNLEEKTFTWDGPLYIVITIIIIAIILPNYYNYFLHNLQ